MSDHDSAAQTESQAPAEMQTLFAEVQGFLLRHPARRHENVIINLEGWANSPSAALSARADEWEEHKVFLSSDPELARTMPAQFHQHVHSWPVEGWREVLGRLLDQAQVFVVRSATLSQPDPEYDAVPRVRIRLYLVKRDGGEA